MDTEDGSVHAVDDDSARNTKKITQFLLALTVLRVDYTGLHKTYMKLRKTHDEPKNPYTNELVFLQKQDSASVLKTSNLKTLCDDALKKEESNSAFN